MTALVLQARLDSARLPGKTMLPLGSRPLIFRVMEALNYVPAAIRILACTEDSAGVYAPLAREAGFELLVGPKEDVLERFCMAARQYNFNQLIRATGDNPFVFADAAAAINAEALALAADYAAYSGLPYGAGVESVNAAALLQAGTEAALPYEREHVCPYLYGHSQKFLLHRPLAPLRWQAPHLRLTIDNEEDYYRAKQLYEALDRYKNPGERFRGTAVLETYREIFQEPLL